MQFCFSSLQLPQRERFFIDAPRRGGRRGVAEDADPEDPVRLLRLHDERRSKERCTRASEERPAVYH